MYYICVCTMRVKQYYIYILYTYYTLYIHYIYIIYTLYTLYRVGWGKTPRWGKTPIANMMLHVFLLSFVGVPPFYIGASYLSRH